MGNGRVFGSALRQSKRVSIVRTFVLIVASLVVTLWTVEGLADPPRHAPAHGWRKKNDPHYVGYTGTRWERDYDIHLGRCNREAVGAVLGGVVGGVIGSRVSEGDNRTVGTVIGAALGALVGAKIGREMDEGDRACIGHALEIGSAGRRIVWENAATGVRYELIPGEGSKSGSGACRDFTLMAVQGSQKASRRASACQSSPGVWRINDR